MKNYYNEKVKLCMHLSTLDVKKVTDSHIVEAALLYKIPFNSAKTAWKNFQETGGRKVDRRGSGTGKAQFAEHTKPMYTKARTVLPREAAKIIIEYMTTNIKTIELCNKHKITPNQFYNWIRELQVSGTLLNKRVLDPRKYAKVEVLDAIRIVKRPNTTKKSIISLSELERAAYERVGVVLQKYLSAIMEG